MEPYDPSLMNLAPPTPAGNKAGTTNAEGTTTKRSSKRKSKSGRKSTSSSSKRKRRRSPSSEEEEDDDESEFDDDDGGSEEEDEDDEDEDDGGRTKRRSTRNKKGKSKKSKNAGNNAGNASFDFANWNDAANAQNVAQVMAILQAQQSNQPFLNPLNWLNPSGGSGGSQQQSSAFRGQPAQNANSDLIRQMEAIIAPLRNDISTLRGKIDNLDNTSHANRTEFTSIKRALTSVADKLSMDLGPSFNTDSPAAGALANLPHVPSSNNFFEQQHPDIPVPSSSGDHHRDTSITNFASILGGTASASKDHGTPAHPIVPSKNIRWQKDGSEGTPTRSLDVKGTGKNKPRKPELSRAVRQTIFKLMGVSAGGPSGSINTGHFVEDGTGTPGTGGKFGPETSRAFHGYTSNAPQLLPDFTEETIIDPQSGQRQWRWDWSKTLRQSPHNAAFATEIRNSIVRAVEDPNLGPGGGFPDVPLEDWQHLDDAIESAYTNMRRERDSQSDPQKLAKRSRHRLLTKKRGLKEEKLRRRRKALDDIRNGEGANKLLDQGITVPVDPATLDGGGDGWDAAMDINLMSSEEEGDPSDPIGTVDVWEPGVGMVQRNVGSSGGGGSGSGGKTFVVSKPAWRSDEVRAFYHALDHVKIAERSHKRVMGPEREVDPPPGTPQWMVKPGVRIPKK